MILLENFTILQSDNRLIIEELKYCQDSKLEYEVLKNRLNREQKKSTITYLISYTWKRWANIYK